MDRENGRGKIALGIGLSFGLVLSVVLIGGLRNSASMIAVQSIQAQASDQTRKPSNFITSDPPREPNVAGIDVAGISDEPFEDVSLIPSRCGLSGEPLGPGSFGDDIFCLQNTLRAMDIFKSKAHGLFDDATVGAVKKFQTLQGLLVDGIVGRKTGLKLGIWPLDPFTVERTPVPDPGAVDLWGMLLSSVATAGPDAPPLPAYSGAGHRLVYDRAAQRIWAVDENEVVIRSWLISGSTQDNEIPGTHKVYSRSKRSISKDGNSGFSYMVRWLKTRDDAIGFHSLPWRTFDDSPYQTEDELGIRLSSGCQRQADLDAQFTWRFAPVGTAVVVL